MTECPIIPSKTDRLAPPSWPKPLARSGSANREQGANRQQPGLKPRQTLRWNGDAAACNLFNLPSNAPETATDPTGSAFSPWATHGPSGFLPERFSNAGHSRSKPKGRTMAHIRKSSSVGKLNCYLVKFRCY